MRVVLTPEAQESMSSLMRKAKGKRVEYGLQLLLSGDRIYPGQSKRGGTRSMITSGFSGVGWFHTHPFSPPRLGLETYRHFGWEVPSPQPPGLSVVDILHILISLSHRLIGVGSPDYSQKQVQFAALKKGVSPKLRAEVLGLIPLEAMFGVPVAGIEDYVELYYFELGASEVPMEVYLG